MPRTKNWTLADVLDFEALVAADERAADPSALAQRDVEIWQKEIAPRLSEAESDNRSLVFHCWLAARRGRETLPGAWLTAGWRWLAGGAALTGLALGFIVAGAALYYAGARPVNVAVFLAITVGMQWLLLAWSLVLILSRGVRAASQRLVVRLGEGIGQWINGALEHFSGPQRLRLRAETANLRQLAGRNLRLLQWPPWLALQGFGIAWNAGVLLALLARVIFTDVAFGWESTAAQGPGGMHAVAQALAAPWTWFAPGACPTAEQVERSWFHYQSGVAALDRAATASWWPWLVGVIVLYGLLPRAALWLYFWTQLRGGLRRLTFDEPRHRAAWYRLTGPVIHAGSSGPDDVSSPGESPLAGKPRRAEAGCLLVAAPLTAARAEIERWVSAQLGWRLAGSEIVEIDFPSGNDAALARIAAALPQAPNWIIAVPAPFTAFAAFTQFVGRIGGPSTSAAARDGFVLVVAAGADGKAAAPEPEWMRYWTDFLRAEGIGCATLGYAP